jgi:hypothetical protein
MGWLKYILVDLALLIVLIVALRDYSDTDGSLVLASLIPSWPGLSGPSIKTMPSLAQ